MSTSVVAPRHETGTAEADPGAFARRRVAWIWALLFLNVLSYGKMPLIVPIPSLMGQAITQGALWLALLLALTINARGAIRPNAFLVLFTLLGVVSFVVTVDGFHLGPSYRAARLIGFLATLWLLTPWFGRRDLLLLRCHLRCLVGVIMLVVVGAVISPHKALQTGRLSGDIWPIPTTQLAHYAAVALGVGAILWMSGLLRRNVALVLVVFATLVLVLTHTRTAVVALVVGLLVATASLFLVRRRVRKVVTAGLIVVALGGAVAAPEVAHWFVRGESTSSFSDLTGRTVVWDKLLNAPRTKAQMLFGTGLSNDSFQGVSIDSSWLATYQTQGLVGDVLIALFLLALLLTAIIRPRGPAGALALFLVVYCIVASYTEVGLGDSSTYLLDLSVAASLLALPALRRTNAPPSPR